MITAHSFKQWMFLAIGVIKGKNTKKNFGNTPTFLNKLYISTASKCGCITFWEVGTGVNEDDLGERKRC